MTQTLTAENEDEGATALPDGVPALGATGMLPTVKFSPTILKHNQQVQWSAFAKS